MKQITRKKSYTNSSVRKNHPIKTTALLYLSEAILKEQYEDCASIIAIAKVFGARDSDVDFILEDPRRVPE